MRIFVYEFSENLIANNDVFKTLNYIITSVINRLKTIFFSINNTSFKGASWTTHFPIRKEEGGREEESNKKSQIKGTIGKIFLSISKSKKRLKSTNFWKYSDYPIYSKTRILVHSNTYFSFFSLFLAYLNLF